MALSLKRYVFMRMAQSFHFWSVCMQGLQINIRGRCAEAVGIAFGMNTWATRKHACVDSTCNKNESSWQRALVLQLAFRDWYDAFNPSYLSKVASIKAHRHLEIEVPLKVPLGDILDRYLECWRCLFLLLIFLIACPLYCWHVFSYGYRYRTGHGISCDWYDTSNPSYPI